MKTIAALVVVCLVWAAWQLILQALTRFHAKVRAAWTEGLREKVKVVSIALAASAVAAIYIVVLPLSWESLLGFVGILCCVAIAAELLFSRRERVEFERLQQNAAYLRWAELATGHGWGRQDVLAKHRTTLFFRDATGRIATSEGWRCAACAKNLYRVSDATVDHVKPRSKYPTLSSAESNLQVLCASCNSTKSAYSGDDWKGVVRRRRRGRRKRESRRQERAAK